MPVTVSENLLFNQVSEKLRKIRKIHDEIRGDRDIHNKRYVSVHRLSELEELTRDAIDCIDTLHLSNINSAPSKKES